MLSSRVRLLSPLHQLPESHLTWLVILGVNLLNSQSVAIKFVSDVPLLLLRSPFFRSDDSETLQEPRKAEAPQLRDECRSYRILAGCGASGFCRFRRGDIIWHYPHNRSFVPKYQPVFPRYTISDKRVCTTFWLLTCWGPASRTCSICVGANSRSRRCAWLRGKWCVCSSARVSPHLLMGLCIIDHSCSNDTREEFDLS